MHSGVHRMNADRRRNAVDYGLIAVPARQVVRIDQHQRPGDVRERVLEQLQPFAADRVFEIGKAREVFVRTSDAFDEAAANGVLDLDKHDRDGLGRALKRRSANDTLGQDYIGLQGDQLFGAKPDAFRIAAAVAKLDVDGRALGPAQRLKTIFEAGDPGGTVGVLTANQRTPIWRIGSARAAIGQTSPALRRPMTSRRLIR